MEPFKSGTDGTQNDFAGFGNEALREIRISEHRASKKKPRVPLSVEFPLFAMITSKGLCTRKKIEKGNTICLPRKLLDPSEVHEETSIHEYIHTTFFQPKVPKRDRNCLLREFLMSPAEAEQVSDVPELRTRATTKVQRKDRMDALRELVMSSAEEEQVMDISDSSTTAWG